MISIHSTTRVETANLYYSPITFNSFQSTPPRGWRLRWMYHQQHQPKFQSTPPRGWRRDITSRSRGDSTISIHSTTRVETLPHDSILALFKHFNPLHHEGGDLYGIRADGCDDYFNPLHHEGGDSNAGRFSICAFNFNPLHHEGGDSNTTQ